MSFKWLGDGDQPRHIEDATLVVPLFAYGNIGQLTIDYLLHNQPSFLKVGSFRYNFLKPVVGGGFKSNVMNAPKLITGIDLFHSPVLEVFLVQIRTSFSVRAQERFLADLVELCEKLKFRQIILLSSSSMMKEGNPSKQTQFFYESGDNVNPVLEQRLGNLFVQLRKKSKLPQFARSFGDTLKVNHDWFLVLHCCCYEGDNTPEASQMATFITQYLSLNAQQRRTTDPPAFRLAGYGREPTQISRT